MAAVTVELQSSPQSFAFEFIIDLHLQFYVRFSDLDTKAEVRLLQNLFEADVGSCSNELQMEIIEATFFQISASVFEVRVVWCPSITFRFYLKTLLNKKSKTAPCNTHEESFAYSELFFEKKSIQCVSNVLHNKY